MKRLWWVVVTIFFSVFSMVPASALDTIPTSPNKVTGPLLITAYSFAGPNVRFVQVFNNSSSLVTLDGWHIASTTKATPSVTTTVAALSGMLEPGKHVFASVLNVIDRPSFTIAATTPATSPLVGSITLVAPAQSGFNDESVTVPAVTASTLKEVDGAASNYYAKRDVSATTGNYVSGFTFILPSEKLKNDQLYVVPLLLLLQVVEVYADPLSCAPSATSLLCSKYVKLHNASTGPIDLSSFRLRTGAYGQASSSSNTRAMSGIVRSGQFVAIPLSVSSSGSWVWVEDAYGTSRYDATMVEYPSNSGHSNEAWSYDEQLGVWRWTTTPTPADTPNQLPVVPVINLCSGMRVSEFAANVETDDQFIELQNTSTQPVDLTGCRLQTNRSATASHEFNGTQVQAGMYVSVRVKDTPLTLTKTTTGTVYLLSSDGNTEVDTVEYENLAASTSYSLVNDSWVESFQPTPGERNVYLQYLPCLIGSIRNVETGLCNKIQTVTADLVDCDEGKYRSLETNRCRAIEPASSLAPCDSDQYRSAETNRCRNLVSTASLLAPCAVNQERNLETNRCRNVATSETDLKACAANQERNPETNRCRNKTSSIATDFPVEAVAQGGEATMGWWAFGGVGTLAAGYAGWEWRREVGAWIKKIVPFGIGRSCHIVFSEFYVIVYG